MAEHGVKFPPVAEFDIRQEIGGGGFAKVYRAIHYASKTAAACKVIPLKTTTTPQERKTWDKEIQVHSAMKHQHVLEFLASLVIENDNTSPYFPAVYMLLELAGGGDLFDKIEPDVGVDNDLAHFYFGQLISGVSYLHGKGICHRDLKPENLLLAADGNLKISDFGLCSVFQYKGKTRLLSERCGSLPYVAPELNGSQPYRAEPVDVWGTGVILFTLLVGNTPWDEPTMDSQEFNMFAAGRIWELSPWDRIRGDARSLLSGLLTIDPDERMSLADVGQHRWFSRPSQLSTQGGSQLGMRLTESLREAGHMDIADPELSGTPTKDVDGDEVMGSSSCATQFTQTLMLFSQTAQGFRYNPHLTRFYTTLTPTSLLSAILVALQSLGVKAKESTKNPDPLGVVVKSCKLGGYDVRKEKFLGRAEIEEFPYAGNKYSFCIMKKEEGNPISWRQLWKAVITHPALEPHVLRKNRS